MKHLPTAPGEAKTARLPAWLYPKTSYYGWILVWTLGITTIISYGTTQYLFGVLVEPISQDMGWNRASISGAYTGSVLLAGLLGVPIGRLVDQRGARLLMAGGSLLAGAALLGLANIQQIWQFYLLWSGGLGVAMALTLYPVTFTVVANWFVRRRGAALALLTLVGGLASPIFIPLAGFLISPLGWRGTLAVMGLIQLFVALPLHALLVRRHPEDLGAWPDGDTAPVVVQQGVLPGVPLRAALQGTPFWVLTGAYALILLATSVVVVHQVPYLIGRGVPGAWAASVAGLVGVSSLPGRYILNWLSDRLGPRRLLSLCLAVQAVGVLLLLGGSLGWLIAYILVYGMAFGAVSPLRASVMAEYFGRRAFGAITAVQGIPVAICAGLGPLAAGWMYDWLGHYEPAFWMSTAAFLLAATSVLMTPAPGATLAYRSKPAREESEGA